MMQFSLFFISLSFFVLCLAKKLLIFNAIGMSVTFLKSSKNQPKVNRHRDIDQMPDQSAFNFLQSYKRTAKHQPIQFAVYGT